MTARLVYEYAVLRARPRADRDEYVNIGVLLYCQQREVLVLRLRIDADRLRLLDPDVDVAAVEAAARGQQATCQGAGPAGTTSLGQRFRWLVSPRSTVVHAGTAHSGLTDDPEAEADRLLAALVG